LKLAVTPPVVGDVSTEIYNKFAIDEHVTAEIFAICIKLKMPSAYELHLKHKLR
jgi:hypothetical protein